MKGRTNEPPKRGRARRPETESRQIPPTRVRRRRPRVYLASSLVTDDVRHVMAVHALTALLPEADLFEAREIYKDTPNWRREWPKLLRRVDMVVFIADRDRSVGAGVLQEVLDARLRNVPVVFLDRRGLLGIDHVAFRFLPDASPSRIAEVRVRPKKGRK